jgi:hypothetical protein
LELQSCLAKTGVFDRKVPLSVRTEKGHHFWPINKRIMASPPCAELGARGSERLKTGPTKRIFSFAWLGHVLHSFAGRSERGLESIIINLTGVKDLFDCCLRLFFLLDVGKLTSSKIGKGVRCIMSSECASVLGQ